MESDLVDADRFRTVLRPEVRVDFETGRLPVAQKKLLGEGSRHRRLADRFLADEAVGMRQPAGSLVSSQDRDGSLMAGDCRKTLRHKCRDSTRPRSWHAAHLNKSFLDGAPIPLLFWRRFRQRSCQLQAHRPGPRRIPSPPVAVHVTALIPMDAEETDQQKKILELQAIISKGLKAIYYSLNREGMLAFHRELATLIAPRPRVRALQHEWSEV